MKGIIKRLFDLTLAIFGILILSPVLLILAIVIKLDSKGPVLYRGARVGKGGRMFAICKFRTMVVDAEKIGGSSTPDDDPRITRSGNFMRKYKLDELPQLWNVLVGEMSFVGPRPQVAWAVERYTPEEKKLLQLRPGITDYASVYFPNEGEILKGSLDPDKDYMEKIHPTKMRLSLKYMNEMGLMTDMAIIGSTIMAILGKTQRSEA